MLLIVEIDLAFQHALLSALQDEYRTGLIEHRDIMKNRLGPENPNTGKCGWIVSLAGSKKARQLHQLPAL
ncbi:hypothetical protein thsrh120_03570 [Rhizobium sp. No.120]